MATMVASAVPPKLCPFRREERSGCGVPLIFSNVRPVRGLWTLDSVQAHAQFDYLFYRNILALTVRKHESSPRDEQARDHTEQQFPSADIPSLRVPCPAGALSRPEG